MSQDKPTPDIQSQLAAIKKAVAKVKVEGKGKTKLDEKKVIEVLKTSSNKAIAHSDVKGELDSLVQDLKAKSFFKKLPSKNDAGYQKAIYEKLIDYLPKDSSEVDIMLGSTSSDSKHVYSLFELLEANLGKGREQETSETLKSSENTNIEHSELLSAVEMLSDSVEEAEIAEKITLTTEEESHAEENFLPSPHFGSLLRATLCEAVLSLCITGFIIWPKEIPLEGIPSIIKVSEHYHDILWLPFAIILIAWFILNCFSTVFFGSTIGGMADGIRVCNTQGEESSQGRRLLRLLCHVFTILSLGIRIILWIKKDNGYYCQFSKTRLTYEAFLKEVVIEEAQEEE